MNECTATYSILCIKCCQQVYKNHCNSSKEHTHTYIYIYICAKIYANLTAIMMSSGAFVKTNFK